MKKIITGIALVFLATTISFGQVDKSYTKALKKMFKVAGTEEVYETVMEQMFGMFKLQYATVEEEVWDDLKKEFMKTSMNDLVEMLAPVYFNHLTEEDLEGIIAFYESPVGEKLAKVTPLITGESMQVGQEWGKKIGEDFTEKMRKKGY